MSSNKANSSANTAANDANAAANNKKSSNLLDKNSLLGKDAGNRTVTVQAQPGNGDKQEEISYMDQKIIGNGSFGVVFQARLLTSASTGGGGAASTAAAESSTSASGGVASSGSGEVVAIKKVLQDRRFKNRELQIMRQLLDHQNIVRLKYFFFFSGDKKEEVFLNLVLEFIPETVYRVARHYHRNKQTTPLLFVKLYMYQLFRALAYIHAKGVCHRDIKPQNLLVDPESGVLKLCDFGSAKILTRGEPNVSYICSRYYRAPELIFGATDYACSIDIWSGGCVMAELLLGQPIFPGDSGVDQLVEIIKVLGTPSRDQIREMNPNYTEFKFPQIKAHPWNKVFRQRTPVEAINLIARLLEYNPSSRLAPLDTCAHAFFNELRNEATRLPNNRPLPPLFDFAAGEAAGGGGELAHRPDLVPVLIPSFAAAAAAANQGSNSGAAGASTNQSGGDAANHSSTSASGGAAAAASNSAANQNSAGAEQPSGSAAASAIQK